MPQRLSRGAPAKYAHFGLIEKAPRQSNNISCSKCIFYLETDKTCSKLKLFMPVAGYDRWKSCNRFQLMKEFDTKKARSYIEKIQTNTKLRANRSGIQIKAKGDLKLKNVLTGVVTVYTFSTYEKGPNILHPSDALAIKARQNKNGKAFSWEGRTYFVVK